MMSCSKILDMVYEYAGNDSAGAGSMPLLNQVQVWMHTIVCPNCAQEIERFEVCRDIMREDFFPSSPGLEDVIMARAAVEEEQQIEVFAEMAYTVHVAPGGLSTRSWVIAGLVILLSLATAFFGLDFKNIASESGISFLLPVGITIGIVLTTYGALFIGSHLKELTERFGL